MSIVRIAPLEDNPIDSLTLQMMLAEPVSVGDQFNVLAAFESVQSLLDFLDSNDVDIVIADIFMKNKAVGLQLIDHLKNKQTPILFISNTQDKAVFSEIQRTTHSRFISKPVTLFTLLSSLSGITHDIQRNKQQHFLKKQYIYLSGKRGEQEQVLFDDIWYIESEGNYSLLFTENKKYAIKRSLNKLLDTELDENFIRVHKRYIINKTKIKVIGESAIKINNQVSVPIGRSYRKTLIDFAKKY